VFAKTLRIALGSSVRWNDGRWVCRGTYARCAHAPRAEPRTVPKPTVGARLARDRHDAKARHKEHAMKATTTPRILEDDDAPTDALVAIGDLCIRRAHTQVLFDGPLSCVASEAIP